jgi:hypothetical protein
VVRVTASTTHADERFCPDDSAGCDPGARIPFDRVLGGEWTERAVTASVDAGLGARCSAGVTASAVTARYADRAGVRTTSGLGDVTLRAHAQVTATPIATGVTVRVKAPTAHEPSSAQFLRLSDGQWDVDLLASIGRSFWPAPAYAFVEGGYRVRTTSRRFTPAIDVGDEVPFHAEAGATVGGRVALRARLTGYVGQSDRSGAMTLPARRLLRAEPSVAVRLGRSGAEVELTGSIPLSGRGVPVTRSLRLSVASAPLAY